MIEIFVQSRYKVNRKKLRERVKTFLSKIGVNPAAYTVSIAIVGDRKMAQVHEQFAGKRGTTPVLSFPLHAGKPRTGTLIDKKYADRITQELTHDGPTLLGEIVISYPQTLIFASDENKLVDIKLGEFVEHGLTTLLSAG